MSLRTVFSVCDWQASRFQQIREMGRADRNTDVGIGALRPLLDVGFHEHSTFSVLAKSVQWTPMNRKDGWDDFRATYRLEEGETGEGIYGVCMEWDYLVGIREALPDGHFLCQNIIEEPLLFPEGYFNTVLCCDTFEHFPSPYYVCQVLSQMYEWLAPGGRLIITTPNCQPIAHPACVLSANHRMLFTAAIWELLLWPPEDWRKWLTETGRCKHAGFADYELSFDCDFLYVLIRKVS